MFNSSITSSIMNMKADIYEQEYSQNSDTGAVLRSWQYARTIECKVEPIKVKGSSTKTDNKVFSTGAEGDYNEKFQIKIKCNELLSKRWRIENIRTSDNKPVFIEIDRYGSPDTIFEVTSSHANLDPFGKISYFEAVLLRTQVQNNDIS